MLKNPNIITKKEDHGPHGLPRRTAPALAPLPPWIKNILKEQRILKRMYRMIPNRENRNKAIKEHRAADWNRKIEELDIEDLSLWKMQKCLRNKRIRLTPLYGPNRIVSTDEEKAEVLAGTVELNFVEHVERSVRQLRKLEGNMAPFRPTSPKEVKEIIKMMAPGRDDISNRMLKNLGKKGIVAIVNITNATMKLTHFPRIWKEAE